MAHSKPNLTVFSTTRSKFDTKAKWALGLLAAVLAANIFVGHKIYASMTTESSAHFEKITETVAAMPAPLSKKLIWIFCGESPHVDGGHAIRKSIDSLPFFGYCNVVMRPGYQSLGPQSKLTLDMQEIFFVLHEKAHCLSEAPNHGLRAGLVVPERLEKSATIKFIKTLAEESYADAYGVLWLAKNNPALTNNIVDEVIEYRENEWRNNMVSNMTPWLIGKLKIMGRYQVITPDEHYTVPGLEALKGELARKTHKELANLSTSDIHAIAGKVSFESVKQYTRAMDKNR